MLFQSGQSSHPGPVIVVIEDDQEIDVAFRAEVAPQHRAENRQFLDQVLLAQRGDEIDRLGDPMSRDRGRDTHGAASRRTAGPPIGARIDFIMTGLRIESNRRCAPLSDTNSRQEVKRGRVT
jgi:hypothetical protein